VGKNYQHKGIRIIGQKNLFEVCFGTPEGRAASAETIDGICMGCRNPECMRAGHGSTLWQKRMRTQVDSLLNDPKFSELSTDDHKRISGIDIPELGQKYAALVIPSTASDSWDLPVLKPARKPDEEWEGELPASLSRKPESEPEPFPEPATEPAPVEAVSTPPERAQEPTTTETEPVPRKRPRNTAVPSGGVMIGGGPSPAQPATVVEDPWVNADKITKIVLPGSQIILKGG